MEFPDQTMITTANLNARQSNGYVVIANNINPLVELNCPAHGELMG